VTGCPASFDLESEFTGTALLDAGRTRVFLSLDFIPQWHSEKYRVGSEGFLRADAAHRKETLDHHRRRKEGEIRRTQDAVALPLAVEQEIASRETNL
jgi:hypothetical protein